MRTPLHVACHQASLLKVDEEYDRENKKNKIVRYLLKHSADPNALDKLGRTPLFELVTDDRMFPLTRKLLKCKASLDISNKMGNTLLTEAIYSLAVKTVKTLVRAGAKVNHADVDTMITPLHAACWEAISAGKDDLNKKIEIAKYLLSHSADPNAQDCEGQTPLFNLGNIKPAGISLVMLLLEEGARTDIKDKQGCTPITYARLRSSYAPQAGADYMEEYEREIANAIRGNL